MATRCALRSHPPHPWGHVHIGFLRGVEAVEGALREFDRTASAVPNVWVNGHSLGGALAVLAAVRLKINKICAPFLFTYGQPAVGLNDFAERFSLELPGRLWRFVNQSDIVTRVPPGPFYRHTGIVKRIVRPGVLEAVVGAEEAAPRVPVSLSKIADPTTIFRGATEELAAAASDAKIERPALIDVDPVPLTEIELGQVQLALAAAETKPSEEVGAEELVWPSWFSDHAIAEYLHLLIEIRDAAGS